jgi:ferredoxin
LFIGVDVDPAVASDAELAKKLEEVCPVEENLDECVLCELCLNASPPGAVKVIKRYDDDALLGD